MKNLIDKVFHRSTISMESSNSINNNTNTNTNNNTNNNNTMPNFDNNNDNIDENKLIKLVHEQGILYDRKSVHFTSETQKQQIWKEIGNKFNCPAADCMAKWMTLRQRFIREKEKEIEREMKLGKFTEEVKSTWKYMEYMRFMEPHVTLRIPSSMVVRIPERFQLSKPSTHKLSAYDESLEDTPTRGGQTKQQHAPEPELKCDDSYETPTKETTPSHDEKEVQSESTKKTLTTFLMTKHNRIQQLAENPFKQRKIVKENDSNVSSFQQNQCKPLIRDEVALNSTSYINTQSSIAKPLTSNVVFTPPQQLGHKFRPRIKNDVMTQNNYKDILLSQNQLLVEKSMSTMSQFSTDRQVQTADSLTCIQEKHHSKSLTLLVTQLLDILKAIPKNQPEYVDTKYQRVPATHQIQTPIIMDNRSCGSLGTNCPSAAMSFTVALTAEELFGRLVAAEISNLDNETLINNAKMLILKIIYKLRLGEKVLLQ